MAVFIQRLVPADAAGIVFSRDPLSGATTLATINAYWGLGDDVASGNVVPDMFTVDRVTREMKSRR